MKNPSSYVSIMQHIFPVFFWCHGYCMYRYA